MPHDSHALPGHARNHSIKKKKCGTINHQRYWWKMLEKSWKCCKIIKKEQNFKTTKHPRNQRSFFQLWCALDSSTSGSLACLDAKCFLFKNLNISKSTKKLKGKENENNIHLIKKHTYLFILFCMSGVVHADSKTHRLQKGWLCFQKNSRGRATESGRVFEEISLQSHSSAFFGHEVEGNVQRILARQGSAKLEKPSLRQSWKWFSTMDVRWLGYSR